MTRHVLLLVAIALPTVIALPAAADALADLATRFEREKEKDRETRYATLDEVAAIGTLEALRFLERVEKDDKDSSMRSHAVHSIARVPIREATDSLLRLYRDGGASRRSVVLSAWIVGRKEDLPASIVGEALAGKDQSVRLSLLTYLSRRDDPRLLPEVRRYVQDYPSSAPLIMAYLIEHPSVESAGLILKTYEDENSYHRDAVPRFFAGAGTEVRSVLVKAIVAGREPLLLNAAQIASRARISEAEEGLVVAARSAKGDERRATYLAFAATIGLATDAGRALALDWLSRDSVTLIMAGARALRARPTADAIPTLIALLSVKSEPVRVEARVTLEQTTGEDFGGRPDLWEAWWRDRRATFDVAKVGPRPSGTLDRALVDLALAKGAAALRRDASAFDGKGEKAPWDCGGHPDGTTALVLLALHAAGTDPKEKVFARALEWLLDQPPPARTYEAGLIALTLETVGGRRFKSRIVEAANLLISTQNVAGAWGYPSGDGDHSNTQYAVLGLRHAARAGVDVPAKTWRAVRDHLLATQGTDGGWSYLPKVGAASASMTGGALSCLLVCLENGDAADPRRAATLAALDLGFKTLGRIAKFDEDGLYALYAMERAGMLGSRSTFGGVPWYALGAKRILDVQGHDGFWRGQYDRTVDSAFAMLFLSKATPPIVAATTGDPAPPAEPARPDAPTPLK